jgi:hypothetical protein
VKNEHHGKRQGGYGSPIQIRFTPQPVVRADKVALVQAAVSTWNDQAGSSATRQTARRRRPARR